MSEISRTVMAAVAAGLLAFVLIGGMAWFLGIPTATSLVSGAVAGALGLVLVLAAARRGGHLDRDDRPSSR